MAYYKEGVILKFVGLSTDTKPTLSTSSVGSKFYETDTKLTYIYSGSAWSVYDLFYGLVFGGKCNVGMTGSLTDIYCADLAGYGNDYFNQKFYVQIIKNANSVGAAPDNELRLITDYVSATGKIVCDPFSAVVQASDEIYVIHSAIASLFSSTSTLAELDVFILTDYDNFDIADADADTERWTPAYITGTEGGSADINTTTAGKLMVAVDPDATPTEARYGVLKKLSIPADYFTIIVDLNVTFGATDSATAKAAGIIISEGTTYNANNFVAVERQKGTAINRIQARATLNGAAQAAANVTLTDTAVALKIERWDNIWRVFYSTVQAPMYDWKILTQYEDPTEYMTGEVCLYFQSYSKGSADAESVIGDFDNYKLYIGAGGGGQYIAGDYDSSHITVNEDGNVFERQEGLKTVEGLNAQLTVPTDSIWDDTNKWWEGNILALLQKIIMYLGAGNAAGNAEITEDTSIPGRLAQDADSVINRIGDLTGRTNDDNFIASLGLDLLPDVVGGDLYTLLWKYLINTAINAPTTKTGLQYLQSIGSNDANNDFASNTVGANADGSVLERLEDILTTYLADGTIGLAAIEALVDGLETDVTAIKAVTDVIPDAGAFTTEFVKTAAIKTETDKIPAFIAGGGIGGAIARKTVTFLNTDADVDLFTVTGTVFIKLVAVCTTNVASAAGCTIGIDAGTVVIIPDTDCTLLAAGEIWHDATPDASVELLSIMKEFIISNGVDIAIDVETAKQVDSGVVEFYCIYSPLSSDGAVVPA